MRKISFMGIYHMEAILEPHLRRRRYKRTAFIEENNVPQNSSKTAKSNFINYRIIKLVFCTRVNEVDLKPKRTEEIVQKISGLIPSLTLFLHLPIDLSFNHLSFKQAFQMNGKISLPRLGIQK